MATKKVKYANPNGIPDNAPEGRTQSVFLNTLGTQEMQPVRPQYTHSETIDEVSGEVVDKNFGLFVNFQKSKASVWLSFGDAKRMNILRRGEDGMWVLAHKELGFQANITPGVAGKFLLPTAVEQEVEA